MHMACVTLAALDAWRGGPGRGRNRPGAMILFQNPFRKRACPRPVHSNFNSPSTSIAAVLS